MNSVTHFLGKGVPLIDGRYSKAGINPVFGPRRVQGNLPGLGAGGGTELLFDQAIPSQFIQRVH
jgi:hypothetical protein